MTPRVFLSYSHDSEAHRAWVRLLAGRLRQGGVEVTLDQWDLPLGADVVRFMDLGIRDADRVLMVCTANYVAKAEERKGGAGYEGMIVTGHVARATDTIKFVPIVRDHAGEPLVPGFLGQRLWLDFRDDRLFEERLEELLRELHGAPRYPKPPLGRNPFAGPELEGGAKVQQSPYTTPCPSRGSRETTDRRQEAGAQQEAKGPSASAAEGNPSPVSAPPAAPAPPITPASGAPPVSTPAAAANPPPLALRPLTVTTAARLRVEGNLLSKRWTFDHQDVRVDACDVDLGEGESLRLIQIPAGDFLMGSPANEPERSADEGPQHRVRLGSFLLGQTPVTQAQWGLVANWPKLELDLVKLDLKPDPSRFKGVRRPEDQVSWEQAMEFCSRLSQRTGLPFTLPSEAQWEYACRAGTTTPFAFGETITPELANNYANGPMEQRRHETTPVASFYANGWGLHDMHGNVWEWCLDTWHGSYEGAPTDGSPWLTGTDSKKLLRGGSWNSYPGYCRSAFRDRLRPDYADLDVGFRVVCLPQDPSLNT